MQTTINLNHLAVFRSVADHKSFTGAARALGSDKAHVSRVVRALEASLGVALVSRTTRSVELTPAGDGLLAMVQDPLDALRFASKAIADRTKTPSGRVTLATTADLARDLLAPLLPSFRARFPKVFVEIRVGSHVESFRDPTLDLALRVGRQTDRTARVRKLGRLEAAFFAAPRYVSARGEPRSLAELATHETAWPIAKRVSFQGRDSPPAPSVGCDDFATVLAFARAGGGVALLPTHLARVHLRDGSLVRILPNVAVPEAPLYLVTRDARPLPGRVEVLRAHIAASLPSLLAA